MVATQKVMEMNEGHEWFQKEEWKRSETSTEGRIEETSVPSTLQQFNDISGLNWKTHTLNLVAES